jgi:hypothetical protein
MNIFFTVLVITADKNETIERLFCYFAKKSTDEKNGYFSG